MKPESQRIGWLRNLPWLRGRATAESRQRSALTEVDAALFAMWDLGDNLVLKWTFVGETLRFCVVRHYAIAEALHAEMQQDWGVDDPATVMNKLLAGPKYLEVAEFDEVCRLFDTQPRVLRTGVRPGVDVDIDLISELVRRYGVTLVRDRAVVLFDAVEFSLQPPIEQVAMLNSLSYSVNSGYRQLLSKHIQVNFARTTTGDGFYIWNRDTGPDANIALYKLMMMVLADNAMAQRKARAPWVPRLRAAFHVGEHYEFHQVEGLNPTTFSYIVGQVTVDLARMISRALPGQILLGDFSFPDTRNPRLPARYDTDDFVDKTAVAVEQLKGLDVSGGRIETIRCYLTGESLGGGRYMVNRYHIRDKHGTSRTVYNAKINIHRERADPIYLGVHRDDLWAFSATKVEQLTRDTEATGSFFIRP